MEIQFPGSSAYLLLPISHVAHPGRAFPDLQPLTGPGPAQPLCTSQRRQATEPGFQLKPGYWSGPPPSRLWGTRVDPHRPTSGAAGCQHSAAGKGTSEQQASGGTEVSSGSAPKLLPGAVPWAGEAGQDKDIQDSFSTLAIPTSVTLLP